MRCANIQTHEWYHLSNIWNKQYDHFVRTPVPSGKLVLLDSYREEITMSTDTKESGIDVMCILCKENPCVCQKQLLQAL